MKTQSRKGIAGYPEAPHPSPGITGRSAPRPKVAAGALAALALMALLPTPKAQAGPTGGDVVAGNVAVTTPTATQMNINQFTDKAIINWNGFNININEMVRFIQPGGNAVILNKVVGGDPTQILDQLSANGQIVLVNPNGVLFGAAVPPSYPKANIPDIMATTFTPQHKDVMGNHPPVLDATKGFPALQTKAQTTMGANGFMNLGGPAVANAGLLVAKLVSETVGGGAKTAVDFYGDGEIQFAIQGAANDLAKDLGGQTPTPALGSKAPFSAADGTVLLSTQAADTIFASVINLDGVVEAKGFAPAAVSDMAAPLAVAMP